MYVNPFLFKQKNEILCYAEFLRLMTCLPSSSVSCTFDSGLCLGWKQETSDKFDWTLRSVSTPSSGTGPSSGHGGSGMCQWTL